MHYAKMAAAGYKGGLVTAPDVGDFCCAKFTQDDTWYRVLVTAVEGSDTGTMYDSRLVLNSTANSMEDWNPRGGTQVY